MPELPLVSPFGRDFSKSDAAALAAVLKALASRTRLRIIHLLHAHGSLNVAELITHLGDLSQGTVSHHLNILQSTGLVEVVRDDPDRPNRSERPRRLSPDAIRSVRDALTIGRRR